MANLTIKRKNTGPALPLDHNLKIKRFQTKTEGLLHLEFVRHLEYYPSVQNAHNIKSAMSELISDGVINMIKENKTDNGDIRRAKDSIAMIRFSLSCSNQSGQHITIDQLIELSKIHLKSAWPFY